MRARGARCSRAIPLLITRHVHRTPHGKPRRRRRSLHAGGLPTCNWSPTPQRPAAHTCPALCVREVLTARRPRYRPALVTDFMVVPGIGTGCCFAAPTRGQASDICSTAGHRNATNAVSPDADGGCPRSALRTHCGRGRTAIRAMIGDHGPDLRLRVELRGLEPLTPTLPVRLDEVRERAPGYRCVCVQGFSRSPDCRGRTRTDASGAQLDVPRSSAHRVACSSAR